MSTAPEERIRKAYALMKQAQRELDAVEQAEIPVLMLARVGGIQCGLSLGLIRAKKLIDMLPPPAHLIPIPGKPGGFTFRRSAEPAP